MKCYSRSLRKRLCCASVGDPVVSLARRMIAEHPHTPAWLISTWRRVNLSDDLYSMEGSGWWGCSAMALAAQVKILNRKQVRCQVRSVRPDRSNAPDEGARITPSTIRMEGFQPSLRWRWRPSPSPATAQNPCSNSSLKRLSASIDAAFGWVKVVTRVSGTIHHDLDCHDPSPWEHAQ